MNLLILATAITVVMPSDMGPLPPGIYGIPTAWCVSDSGKQWAERGTICHLDPKKRVEPVCGLQDSRGRVYLPLGMNVGGCAVPPGFNY